MTTSETEIDTNSNFRHFYLNLFLFNFLKRTISKRYEISKIITQWQEVCFKKLLPLFNPDILETDFNLSSTFMSENKFQINSESLISTTQNLCASKLLLRTKTSTDFRKFGIHAGIPGRHTMIAMYASKCPVSSFWMIIRCIHTAHESFDEDWNVPSDRKRRLLLELSICILFADVAMC